MARQARELVNEDVWGWGSRPVDVYYLEYEDDALCQKELARVDGVEECVDPSRIYEYKGFRTLTEARRWWKRQSIQAGKITKVVNLREITQPEDWPLRRWAWDEELVEER